MYKYLLTSVIFAVILLSGCAMKPATSASTPLPPATAPNDSTAAASTPQPHYRASDIETAAVAGRSTPSPAAAEPVFETIYFDYDSALLSEASRSSLVKAAELFRDNPNLKATIAGYCDDRGSEMYNIALGERRAIAIKDYLAHLGIKAQRLEIVSFGEENPAVIGFDERARALNRRGTFTEIATAAP